MIYFKINNKLMKKNKMNFLIIFLMKMKMMIKNNRLNFILEKKLKNNENNQFNINQLVIMKIIFKIKK